MWPRSLFAITVGTILLARGWQLTSFSILKNTFGRPLCRYLTYGEPEWRARVERCLARMNLFSDEARHSFEHTLSWLNQWACSRSFGLGSRLPWDPEYLIESLSDSTIYMAYYTVAHFLQVRPSPARRSDSHANMGTCTQFLN